MDTLLVIILLSTICQFLAAYEAIRLIRVSGAPVAWGLLCAGFLVQGIRRVSAFFENLHGLTQGDLTVESLGLLISLLIACGIWMIGPFFARIQQSNRDLIEQQDELAKIHQKLIESQTRYRIVADFAYDWEYWLAPDKSIRYISPSCERLCGYTQEEFYCDPQLLSNIVCPQDLTYYENHTHYLQDNGDPEPVDFRIITRDGQERWIAHVCRQIVDKDGTWIGWRASNRDITERKQIEQLLHEQTIMLEAEAAEHQRAKEALEAKTLELETLNNTLEQRVNDTVAELRSKDQLVIGQSRHAAMGEMIHYIAHQWRNPLNNLALIIQGISFECNSGRLTHDELSLRMEKVMDLISYMSRTIDDFRYFFRMDKAKSIFSVREAITRTISLIDASLKDNNIRIVVDIDKDLLIEGFPNEYAQALLNLLSNARDAVLGQPVAEPVIRVKLFQEEGNAVLTVSDNGGGIPENIIDHIFDPYFTTKEEGKGTGIGLFMTKTIIEKNMGGHLLVRNIEDGAEFRMEVRGHCLA